MRSIFFIFNPFFFFSFRVGFFIFFLISMQRDHMTAMHLCHYAILAFGHMEEELNCLLLVVRPRMP